ncbi:hypothetical protein GCM10009087_03630 [Sphingomonas oligophenolica]|uniref:Uncharacterized protein n=1 Tax=Sphingomonas oligophenolica TaxID=301154 RepID=A0ABU9Y630_9SPHN
MNHITPEWAQVITGALSAIATLFAVVAAMWLPRAERQRAAGEVGRALMELTNYAIDFGGRLETDLLRVDPEKERQELKLLLAVAERLTLRQSVARRSG